MFGIKYFIQNKHCHMEYYCNKCKSDNAAKDRKNDLQVA